MFKSRSDFFEKTGRYLKGYNDVKKKPKPKKVITNPTDDPEEEEGTDEQLNGDSNGHLPGSSPSPDPTQPITAKSKEDDDKKYNKTDDDEYDAKQRQKARTQSSPSVTSRRPSFLLDIAFASIDDHDRQRLSVITRYFMLSALSIITTQIAYISVIIGLIIVSVSDIELNQNVAMGVFGGLFYPFEVVLNCMALYLTFQYASDHYNKLCSCCHERCGIYVVRRASHNILRSHSTAISDCDINANIDPNDNNNDK